MTNCLRHLKALTKKNSILWYRTPCCAFFEFFVPAFLMAILCVLRYFIPYTHVDAQGMLKKNLPIFPGVTYYEGWWSNNTDNNELSDVKNRPLIGYSGHTNDYDHLDDPYGYHMGTDDQGPQFYTPTHCLKQFDY